MVRVLLLAIMGGAAALSPAASASSASSAPAATEVPAAAEAAFARYLEVAARHRQAQLADDEGFLDLATVTDADLRRRARRGEVAVRRIELEAAGDDADPPGALVHHWIGTIFIPGTNLQEVIDVVSNFEDYPRLFAPEVDAARQLEEPRDGSVRIYMRFRKTKVITTVIDTEQVVHLERPRPDRAYSTAWATMVREVDNPGRADERLREDGEGLLWRLFASWRYLEADGGVWIENESIMLTRQPGFPLRLVMQPMLKAGPREGVEFALRKLGEELRR